ncbi:MAG TPA: hypothetical protein VIX19_11600 [Terriglobales bacterium]
MDFDSLVATMDNTLVNTFQKVDPVEGVLEVTLHGSPDGSDDTTVPCIVKNPIMEEDYTPGTQPGTKMLVLFIPASAGVVAVLGYTATYNGVDYDVVQSDADRCGGVHIRMRGRTQPWNT